MTIQTHITHTRSAISCHLPPPPFIIDSPVLKMTSQESGLQFTSANSNTQNPSNPSSTRSYALLNEIRSQGRCERCGKPDHSSDEPPPRACRDKPPVSDSDILAIPLKKPKEPYVVPAPRPDAPWPAYDATVATPSLSVPTMVTGNFN